MLIHFHSKLMAHNAGISSLVDRLINFVVKNSSKVDFERCKGSALRTLTNDHSARVNQFEITARLDGLEDKWRILNNDPLAGALQQRRAELSVISNRWTPEILSLLLQLSDRPADHSNVVDLALPNIDIPSAPLTWADIVAEDPLDDRDGIWHNVDFTASELDDERTESFHSEDSILTPEFSGVGQGVEACIETLIEPAATISLCAIQDAQFWNMRNAGKLGTIREEEEGRGQKRNLTELQAVREVIFLLLGLPTSIFSQKDKGEVTVSKADFLEHASEASLTGLLHRFVAIANKLLSIRQWVGKDNSVPLQQTFQAALASRLATVDRALSAIQTRILSCKAGSIPSLLELYDETSNISRLLLQVHDVLPDLDVRLELKRPFRVLECLFDKTCVNQSIGDIEGYRYMANLFFECFQTYLEPIRLWMEKGQLTGRDGLIFVQKDDRDVHLKSLWQDQYHLIEGANGGLHAPKFLHVAAKKIFIIGKSADFLRRLGREDHEPRRDPAKEVAMTYESVCLSADPGPFSPFAEHFSMSLDRWVANEHQASLSELRFQLESRCGLQSSLDALDYIYFANGAVSTNVNHKIFEMIDRGNHRWSEAFILTELFRSAFQSIPCVDTDRLEICPSSSTKQESMGARRSMSVLQEIQVSYSLPWPVANVIRPNSVAIYQHVFVFLTQLQRAKYLLQRQKQPRREWAVDEKPLFQLYTLRHRLLWLTDIMLTYITDMVISVATSDMRIAMDQAEDADSMIAIHQLYITKIEDQCLLLKKHASIRQAIISLLDLTVIFSDVQASYTTGDIPSDSKNGFIETKANRKHATQYQPEKLAKAASDDEDSDYDSGVSSPRSALHADPPNTGRLKQMLDTFRELSYFVTAAVRGISKADSAPPWEMLANNLAMGLEK